MSQTIIWSRCPYCKKNNEVKVVYGSTTTSKLGEPKYNKCKYCGNIISNGKKEWPQLSTVEKTYEIIRFGFLGIFRGFIIGGLGSFVVFGMGFRMLDSDSSYLLLIISGFSVFIFILFIKYYYDIVKKSSERYYKMNANGFKTSIDSKEFDNNKIIRIKEKLENVNVKIAEIMVKQKILIENNDLLKENITSDKVVQIINKNEEIISFLNKTYDRFVSASISLYFSGLCYYLLREDIKKISIKEKIREISIDMDEYIHRYFPKSKTLNEISNLFKLTGSAVKKYLLDLNSIQTNLVVLQNKAIIGSMSPIDMDDFAKSFSILESEKVEVDLDIINEDYDKFLAETDVLKYLSIGRDA